MKDSSFYQIRSVSLIEDDIKSQIHSLHDNYLQLNKAIDAMMTIDQMPMNEFREQKSEFERRNEEVKKKIGVIEQIVNTLKSTDIKKDDLKNKANKIIKKIQSNLRDKIAEYNRLKKSIEDRQSYFYADDYSERPSIQTDFNNGLNFKDYTNNKDLVDQRNIELERLKAAAAQVASLSNEMREKIYDDNKLFNAVEDNVNNVYMNVNSGGKEIIQMEKIKKSEKKKIIYLVIACIILLLFVLYLFRKIFF